MNTTRWGMGGVLAIMALVCLMPGYAAADSITGLYNTGVDASGDVLSHNDVDTHYTVTPPDDEGTTYAWTSDGDFPVGDPWLDDNDTSAWITPYEPVEGSGDSHPVGEYTYTTTFDLTGMNPASASISGQWSSDNDGFQILINDTDVNDLVSDSYDRTPTQAFTEWYDFTISDGFEAGENTLQFVVNNESGGSGNPTGLRVEYLSSAVSAVPEPASCALLGLGLLGLSVVRKRSMYTRS